MFAPAVERLWRDAWPLVAQTGDGNPWMIGACWLYCRREGVRVLWIGSVNTPGATGDVYACGPCISELDHMVRVQSHDRDGITDRVAQSATLTVPAHTPPPQPCPRSATGFGGTAREHPWGTQPMAMTAAPVGPQRYQERYTARPEAAAQARRDIALALETWGLPQLVDVARQVVTELVANAVEHTDSATVGASITRTGAESARIAVTDTSGTRPTLGTPAADDENGRGLMLVDALAHAWGSELVHGGKRVWAELRVDGPR